MRVSRYSLSGHWNLTGRTRITIRINITLVRVRQCFDLLITRLGKGQIKYCRPTGPPVNTNCQFCQNTHHVGGPVWIAPLHDIEFVSNLLDSVTEERFATVARMTGMLSMVLEELPDIPLYYELSRLCNITKLNQGKITEYLSAILNAGYRVSLTHANKVTLSPTSFYF